MGRFSFFDFDGTLIKGDSFPLFIRHALGWKGFIKVSLLSIPNLLAWKLGALSNSEAKQRIFSHAFRGMDAAEFERHCQSFSSILFHRENPEAMKALREALQQSDTVAIVSASVADWIRPWATGKGTATIISTEIEKDSHGKITGHFSLPNCHGMEKSRRILVQWPELSPEHPSRKNHHVTAWGDSAGDDAMLALADEPHRI